MIHSLAYPVRYRFQSATPLFCANKRVNLTETNLKLSSGKAIRQSDSAGIKALLTNILTSEFLFKDLTKGILIDPALFYKHFSAGLRGILRRLRIQELPFSAIYEIFRAENPRYLDETYFLDDDSTLKDLHKSYDPAQRAFLWLLKDKEKKVQGVIEIKPLFQSDSVDLAPLQDIYRNQPKDKIAYMGTLFLAKQYRRQGIGEWLLDSALKKAKQFGYQKVVLVGNLKFSNALNLYLKKGFRFIEEQPYLEWIIAEKDL